MVSDGNPLTKKLVELVFQGTPANENRPPEGGRRFLLVAGARYSDKRNLGRVAITLGIV
jgi:hypothetical protein